ncbi:glycosyltransferase [Roseiconus lacunae]|uniref:glycosyltransferase n=1 Tax=Roseiconus lacunae TaxID=2605694 RepID=UPI0011F17B13|nr:glycosyltransferase [Roseiconus lacunae]
MSSHSQLATPNSKLLYLCHRFPYPPNRGDRIRSYNQIRVLAESFEITLACPHDEPVTREQREHMRAYCREILTEPVGRSRWIKAVGSAAKGRSLTEGLFANASLQRSILQSQRRLKFDSVFVFCSSMYPYVDHAAFAGVRKVVDLVDVDSMKWEQLSRESSAPKRPVYGLEARRVKRLEQTIADQADAVILVSDSEADEFRNRIQTDTPIEGVSNGVDTDYFRPLDSLSNPRDESRVARSSNIKHSPNSTNSSQLATSNSAACRLVFTGVLDYPPNVEGMRWFCNDILPRLRERIDVRLNIVGRRPNQIVKQLAQIDGVTLVGEVPDVRPHLHAADIAISPLKLARGIQNKVLEAMASGLPVVTTSQSAEGIDAIDGQEFVIADTVEAWLESLSQLSQDAPKRQSIGQSARQRVLDDYSWQAKLAPLTQLAIVAFRSAESSVPPLSF